MSESQITQRIAFGMVETLITTGRYTTAFQTTESRSAALQISLCHGALEKRDDEIASLTARIAAAEAANERMTKALTVIADWRGMLAWNRDLRAIAKTALEAAKGGRDE
jgi:hypothetical protein